jgi:acyl dehydratase
MSDIPALYFEDYAEGWSMETPSKTITEDEICTFVDLHAFYTPTFTDNQYLQDSKEYKGRMAPGLMVLCMAEGLVLNLGVTRKRGIFLMELSPKFRKPVYAGDAIVNRFRFHSKKVTSKPDRGVVMTSHEVVTDKGDVAITYLSTRMIRTRLFVD